MKSHWNHYWISLHMISGATLVQQFLFLVNAAFAFSFMIGYKTFYSNILCLFLVSSYHARNNVVNHGGDVYMRLLQFWALFLPVTSCFSVDNWLARKNTNKKKIKKPMVVSGGSLGILTQICLVYVTSYFHKYGDEWHIYGTSTQYALMLDYFRLPLGTFMLNFPTLMKFGTFAVLYFEAVGVLMFFSPILHGPIKALGVFFFILMHAAFGLCMGLGIFSFISSTAVIPMLPSWFWDDIVFPRLSANTQKHVKIWYYPNTPGEYLATFATNFLLPPDSCFLSTADSTLTDESFNWMAVERNGRITTRFEAFEELCRVSPLLWPMQKALQFGICRRITKSIFNLFTILISVFFTPPPRLTREDAARTKRTTRYKKNILSFIGVCFTIYIFIWNLGNFGNSSVASLPVSTLWIGYGFRVDQMWNMFSPHPPKSNWWYTIEGVQDDGTKIEIWRQGHLTNWVGVKEPYETKEPENLGSVIGNHRWVKFYEYVNWGDNPEVVRLGFGRYICREWNAKYQGPERLHTFNIIYHQAENLLDGARIPLKSTVWWSHMCYEK
eukprot:Phypoly_transcript_05818.p1 GENE.Phypoly_transcript_05818~~Phypoly_transcript_05818.p1  ORF type:complete len:625 (+),score=40.45 Phypoly_transcript_05818:215-1876(+)